MVRTTRRQTAVVPLPDDVTVDALDRAFAATRVAKQVGRVGLNSIYGAAKLKKSRPGGPYRVRMTFVIAGNADTDLVILRLTPDRRSLLVTSVDWSNRIYVAVFAVLAVFFLLIAAAVGSPLDDWNWKVALICAGFGLASAGVAWLIRRVAKVSQGVDRRSAAIFAFEAARDVRSPGDLDAR